MSAMENAVDKRHTQIRNEIDASLLREQAFIGGEWRAGDDASLVEVRNPATRTVIGHIPDLGMRGAGRAVDAAADAADGWRGLLADTRAEMLLAWYRLILEHRESLATLMTLEQGKPLGEARGEIEYAASFVRWFAEEGRRLHGATLPSHLPEASMYTVREPVGISACVTPWNFPSAMITRKAAAALAAGCPVVVSPSPETPFSGLALAALADRAGLPAGVLNVVTGLPQTVVGALTSDVRVRALSFTGSTEVGRLLLSQCAPTIKRVSLELGGHAPFLAFPDQDLDTLVQSAIAAKFQTSGQDCLAANRLYVHRQIYAAFVERFTEATRALRVGDGFDPEAQISPLINERAVEKMEAQVANARAHGARVTTGGERVEELGPLYYAPTVLADVTSEMVIHAEETFGPIAAVMPFDDEESAVQAANANEHGLIAYLFTQDRGRIARLTQRLEYGMVAVNAVNITGAQIPFGGYKQSGLGREGGHDGIFEFTESKYVCVA